jgi:hypothetical protein
VGAGPCTSGEPRRYFFGAAAFFFAGFAPAAALSRPAVRFFAMRALSFRCLVRRRIFMERRLSRLPMRRLIAVRGPTVNNIGAYGPGSCHKSRCVLTAY